MADKTSHTAITEIAANTIRYRGYPVEELMGTVGFAGAIYLVWMGELPSAGEARLLNAIFVSSLDHGTSPPSTHNAMVASGTGASISAAIAAGTLAINNYHGGAIENCMKQIANAIHVHQTEDMSLEDAVTHLFRTWREKKRRLFGFGHRIHSDDPRAKRLFALAEEESVADLGIKTARLFSAIGSQELGRELPINVDGAIGAVLVDMGIPPAFANVFFITARVPGMAAHALEERVRERPMRKIVAGAVEYDGHPLRHLENE